MNWLTLGELRRLTAHLPDDTPITADAQGLPSAGAMWYNIELLPEMVEQVEDGETPSLILNLLDTFDTRQW